MLSRVFTHVCPILCVSCLIKNTTLTLLTAHSSPKQNKKQARMCCEASILDFERCRVFFYSFHQEAYTLSVIRKCSSSLESVIFRHSWRNHILYGVINKDQTATSEWIFACWETQGSDFRVRWRNKSRPFRLFKPRPPRWTVSPSLESAMRKSGRKHTCYPQSDSWGVRQHGICPSIESVQSWQPSIDEGQTGARECSRLWEIHLHEFSQVNKWAYCSVARE